MKVNEGTKLRFLVNDSFERKLYIKEAAGHTAVKITKHETQRKSEHKKYTFAP